MGSLQRHLIGIAAVVLGTIALVVGLGFGWTDNTGSWTMGTFGKVAFVLAIMWLAWPQMLRLKELPGGGVALVSVVAGIIVLAIRPRLLLYFLPLLVSVSLFFLIFTWVQRNIFPPK